MTMNPPADGALGRQAQTEAQPGSEPKGSSMPTPMSEGRMTEEELVDFEYDAHLIFCAAESGYSIAWGKADLDRYRSHLSRCVATARAALSSEPTRSIDSSEQVAPVNTSPEPVKETAENEHEAGDVLSETARHAGLSDAEVLEAVQKGVRGEAMSEAESAAWLGYEIGWRDGSKDRIASPQAVNAELLAALLECQDKLWVARCNSGDEPFRQAAERACDMASSAIASAKAQPSPSVSAGVEGWRPIETAPKDGTHITGLIAGTSFGYFGGVKAPEQQTTIHWFEHGEDSGWYTSINEVAPQRAFGATHWRPLAYLASPSGRDQEERSTVAGRSPGTTSDPVPTRQGGK